MPSWNELISEFDAQKDDAARTAWLTNRQQTVLQAIGHSRGDRNVLFYASAFLQKPLAPSAQLQINFEDLNGFMSVIYGMDWRKGLTLLLHTPGGVTNATETIVAYLWSKFPDIEVVVPTYAMSAGTMISLAADRIIMGRQSQLGPIDPQMVLGGGSISARAVVDQFDLAKGEILANPILANAWAPILASIGPALLQEARNALDYSERMVASWLAAHMLKSAPDPSALGDQIAAYFNDASMHKSHGRRIDRAEARNQNVVVQDLEDDQQLQEAVLTAYHVATIIFQKTPAVKFLSSHAGRQWIKNHQ